MIFYQFHVRRSDWYHEIVLHDPRKRSILLKLPGKREHRWLGIVLAFDQPSGSDALLSLPSFALFFLLLAAVLSIERTANYENTYIFQSCSHIRANIFDRSCSWPIDLRKSTNTNPSWTSSFYAHKFTSRAISNDIIAAWYTRRG